MCDSSVPPVEGMFNRRSLIGGVGALAATLGLAACSTGASTEAAAATTTQDDPPESSPMELVLLGTQGGPPVDDIERSGIATALVVDGDVYLIDCGRSSVTQYAKSGLRFENLKSIFITHLHVDHLADYYNFFTFASSPNSQRDQLAGPIDVYGPGSAGGLPPKLGGGEAPTVAPQDPTPGIAALTDRCHEAYAYSSNIFIRDTNKRDIREMTLVNEIAVPDVGASFENTAPSMQPFVVMEDDKVKVTATLVPHGPVFPAFAYRFDTAYGSVTFSGDTAYSKNLITLARDTDVLVHEAVNLDGVQGRTEGQIAHIRESHIAVQEVGPVAQSAGAPTLVLSHLADLASSPIDVDRWTVWAQRGYDGTVIIGQDLQRIPVRAQSSE